MSPSRALRLPRLVPFAVVVTMLGVLAGLAPPVTPARPAPQVASASAEVDRALQSITEGDVQVILQTRGDGVAAERAVAEVGGTVRLHLPLVDGLAATVPARDIPRLATAGGLRAITLDRRVTVQGEVGSGSPNSVYGKAVRADDAWAAGVTGRGVVASTPHEGTEMTVSLPVSGAASRPPARSAAAGSR